MAQVTLTEAAKRIGITRQGVLNRIKSGKLHGVQVDGRWLIDMPTVDAVEAPDRQVLIGEVERLRAENALLQAKIDGMERVLTAFSGGELIRELTMNLQQHQALSDQSAAGGSPRGFFARLFARRD